MFNLRIGIMNRQNTHILRRLCQIVALLLVIVLIIVSLSIYRPHYFKKDFFYQDQPAAPTKTSKLIFKPDPCASMKSCPEDHFSFYMLTGAANVILPKICVQGKLVLGAVLNNAGIGINIVLLNGQTGDVIKAKRFNTFDGDVEPLIKFLHDMDQGSLALMATFDEPSSKLTAEVRKLIGELGSSHVESIGFRSNWAFVGGKGISVKSSFEKFLKSDGANNKYDGWPEMLELEGCIPRYMPPDSPSDS